MNKLFLILAIFLSAAFVVYAEETEVSDADDVIDEIEDIFTRAKTTTTGKTTKGGKTTVASKGGKGKGKTTTTGKKGKTTTTGKGKGVVPITALASKLAKARSGLQTTILNDFHLYVIGGTNGPRVSLPQVEVYDIKSNTWAEQKPLLIPRNGAGVVGLNGEIWVISGIQNGDLFDRTVEIFTPPTVVGGLGAWRFGPNVTIPRWNLGAVNLCNEIFAIGGFDIVVDSNPQVIEGITVVEIYNPVDNTWRMGTPLPGGRAAFGSVILNGEIWVIGGELEFATGTSQQPTTSVISYSRHTQAWHDRAPLPVARVGFGATVIDNRIYVAGGRTKDGVPVREVHVYDPVTGAWSVSEQVFLSGDHTRFNNAVGSLFNNLFLLGGRADNKKNNFLDTVEAYIIR